MTGKNRAGESFTEEEKVIDIAETSLGDDYVYQDCEDFTNGNYFPNDGEIKYFDSTGQMYYFPGVLPIFCLRPGETRTYYFKILLPEKDDDKKDYAYTNFKFYFRDQQEGGYIDLTTVKQADKDDLQSEDLQVYEDDGDTYFKGSLPNKTGHYIKKALLLVMDEANAYELVPISNMEPDQTNKFDTKGIVKKNNVSWKHVNKESKVVYYIIYEDKESSESN